MLVRITLLYMYINIKIYNPINKQKAHLFLLYTAITVTCTSSEERKTKTKIPLNTQKHFVVF